jgi:hypothetical protein
MPNGPANVGGLNNSGNDPSGVGNAAKSPDAPVNNTVGNANSSNRAATTNSSENNAANPGSDGNPSLARSSDVPASGGVPRQNGTTGMSGNGQATQTTEQPSDAQIDSENRKLDAKVKSICKGC